MYKVRKNEGYFDVQVNKYLKDYKRKFRLAGHTSTRDLALIP